jgi:hypothetical protein
MNPLTALFTGFSQGWNGNIQNMDSNGNPVQGSTDFLNSAERDLYLARRTRADYRAYKKGGVPAVAKRVARRKINRKLFSIVRKAERNIGL